MNATNPYVTHANRGSLPRWCFSTMSGYGIDGLEVHIYRFPVRDGIEVRDRHGRHLMVKHSSYGTLVKTEAEARVIAVRDGVIFRYGRNTCRFVQSRAARKRGYVATDGMYTRTVQLHALRREPQINLAG